MSGRVGCLGALLAMCLVVVWTDSVLGQEPVRGGWDRQAAAAYLDGRQSWWMDWPTAARDQGTYCVSCHTVTPYALGRAALRRVTVPGAVERRMLDSVEHRVLAWDEMQPFYSDEQVRPGKTRESRGTEAILNVLILANRDAQAGRLSGSTKQAFEHLGHCSEQTARTPGHGPGWTSGLSRGKHQRRSTTVPRWLLWRSDWPRRRDWCIRREWCHSAPISGLNSMIRTSSID